MTTTGLTATSISDPRGKGRDGVLRAARRHSAMVRLMRFAFPALAVSLVAGLWAAIVFDPRARLAAAVDADSIGVSGSKIMMEQPKITGYNKQQKSYTVTATRAEQNLTDPALVDLFDLTARMQVRDNGWAELLAPRGRIDSKKQTLNLYTRISISTDLGERAELEEAFVDFGNSEIITQKPVVLNFPRIDLRADAAHLGENGDSAVFTGRVVMVLKPDTQAPVAPAPEGMK